MKTASAPSPRFMPALSPASRPWSRLATLACYSLPLLALAQPQPLQAAAEKTTPAAAPATTAAKTTGERKAYTFANTEERIIKSAAGKEYRIMISWPEGPAPAAGHAVTYVLDADELFPLLTTTLRVQAGTEKLSKHNAIAPGIIVGIGYPGESGRNVDYTPAAPKGPPETYVNGKPYPPQESGGAEAFHQFLQNELKPVIEKDYPVNPQRQALLGNGYGGLFVLHTLFTKPESFQTYIASSPSVWWNNRYILEEEAAFAERLKTQPVKAHLVMTVGELEQSLNRNEFDWPEAPRAEHANKVTRRRMVDNTREMFWRLEKSQSPGGFKITYRIFAEESHKSVIPMALSNALPYVFAPEAKH